MNIMNKKNNPQVTVCLTTHNRHRDLLECLDSIYSSRFQDFEVIVFDNHSRIKLTRKILTRYPRLNYFYSKKNLGGAGGRLFCEKKARGEFVMVLDDDTIIDENTLLELVNAMKKDYKIGMAGPKIYFYDGKKTNVLLGGLGKISKITTQCKDIAYRQTDIGQFLVDTNHKII